MNKAYAETRKRMLLQKLQDPEYLLSSYERQKIKILEQKEDKDG